MNKRAFTLMEVLLVVLIIGILAAIALPLYNRAVQKSRFAALIPVTKSMANANEAYYLEHGTYTNDPSLPDIASQTQHPDGTVLILHQDNQYAYAMSTRTDLNNTYVVYQNHSRQFANNVHCEAKNGDEIANWICETAFHGTKVTRGSLTDGYTTYILDGSPTDGSFATDYTNQSGIELTSGDTCTATQSNGCQNITASGSTCTAEGSNGCSNSTFENNSVCEAESSGGCINSTFTDSTCEGGVGGTCRGSTFINSTCSGGASGNNGDNTTCGSNSTYINSVCINEPTSTAGYVCGRSTYTSGSACYSNRYGGCGRSTYTGSSCYAESNTACDNSHFKDGSVCYANAYDGCKLGSGSYDSTSYCAGDFCPTGPPKQGGGTWRRCDNAHNDPADRVSQRMSC